MEPALVISKTIQNLYQKLPSLYKLLKTLEYPTNLHNESQINRTETIKMFNGFFCLFL